MVCFVKPRSRKRRLTTSPVEPTIAVEGMMETLLLDVELAGIVVKNGGVMMYEKVKRCSDGALNTVKRKRFATVFSSS